MNWLLNKSLRLPDAKPVLPDHTSTIDYETLLFDELMAVVRDYPYIRMDDYEMNIVREQIIRPIAAYISSGMTTPSQIITQPPLIVSGEPGIGKTTLLMMIDQALSQLDLGIPLSCRDIIKSGKVAGYYGSFKGAIDITPLRLQETPTAVLSIVDWRNIQRHWTYDSQTTHKETPEATAHFLNTLRGKVVFVDDAEREGHVYVVSQLAQHGILVVISSNLDHKALHIDEMTPLTAHLRGIDHRVGDISAVCLPLGDHTLFDLVRDLPSISSNRYDRFKIIERHGARVAYAQWASIKSQPFLKDTFAEYFRKHNINGVLIDEFPFFSGLKTQDIDPEILGYLYRFVHLVDAVHDLQLPFLLRMTRSEPLTSDYRAAELEQGLRAYDQRIGGQAGATAWIEMSRCISRLRSRQSLNGAFFPSL